LSLVLRNQVDTKTVSTSGITKNQLFGDEQPAPAKVVTNLKPVVSTRAVRTSKPAPQAEANCVEVIQNGARVLNCF
jgi:pilus assembly protein CpaB